MLFLTPKQQCQSTEGNSAGSTSCLNSVITERCAMPTANPCHNNSRSIISKPTWNTAQQLEIHQPVTELAHRLLTQTDQTTEYHQTSKPQVHHIVRRWGRHCYLTILFPIVDTWLSYKDIARQSCVMAPKWRFFASCIFSEPRAAHFRHAF